jgi:hypothetical protein
MYWLLLAPQLVLVKVVLPHKSTTQAQLELILLSSSLSSRSTVSIGEL